MKSAREQRKAPRRSGWAMVVAMGVIGILSTSPALPQSRGQCAHIEAPWPMVLPDGLTHHAGVLKLCLQQMWTPASGLHEIRINGRTIGLFMSRIGTSEEPVQNAPVVVFQRNGTDELHLVGYAWPDGDSMRTYVLRGTGKAGRAIARNASLPLLSSDNTEIVIAAPPS